MSLAIVATVFAVIFLSELPDKTALADSPSSPGIRMEAAFTASSAT